MTDTPKVDMIELRCSENPRRMFAKLLRESVQPPPVVSGNLLEFACRDCTKRERDLLRESGIPGDECERVLHRFNAVGELVESEVVYAEMADNEDSG